MVLLSCENRYWSKGRSFPILGPGRTDRTAQQKLKQDLIRRLTEFHLGLFVEMTF